MDGVRLILEAHGAGLTLHLDGDRLVIRGPRSAEATAQRLLADKSAVVAALRGKARWPPTASQHAAGGVERDAAPAPGGDLAGTMFEGWCPHAARGGGTVWLPADAAEPDTDLGAGELADALPCPRCGSLETWQDLLGAWHCIPCDRPAFERARRRGERVERIRQRTRPAALPADKMNLGRLTSR